MLMGNDFDLPLLDEKQKALEYLKHHGLEYAPADDIEYRIEYPVKEFPSKIVSTDFEKEPTISGLLTGIKGQYLLFEGGRVINLRKHTGYHISIIEE
jgi:hypothetical protein